VLWNRMMCVSQLQNIIMEIQQIQQADILDILFEGRNKDYGAYQLRKTYNARLKKSIGLMASICLLLIGGYTLAGKTSKTYVKPYVIDNDPTLVDVAKDKTVVPPPVIPKPHPMVQVATIQSTIPRIVPNDQVKPTDVPPTQEEQDNVKIGDHTQKGSLDDGTDVAPPSNGGGTDVVEGPKRQGDEDDGIYRTVEIESLYPGGTPAWQRLMHKNFHVPDEAIDNNISGTVIVQFIVDKEGNVSDVQAISGPELLQKEAVRVIKLSGKWIPAIQNGRKVNSYKRQPITVQLENQ